MSSQLQSQQRLAVLASLVEKAPQSPGRTALMKFAYLLQAVRGVPLGYRFELYNYGPYDAEVLSDLSQAQTLKAIKSETVTYPNSSGYAYSVNPRGFEKLREKFANDLSQFDEDLDWVVAQFGTDSASRLELVSTIVFAEREMRRKRQAVEAEELCRRVKQIKPHFSSDVIALTIDELVERGIITAATQTAA